MNESSLPNRFTYRGFLPKNLWQIFAFLPPHDQPQNNTFFAIKFFWSLLITLVFWKLYILKNVLAYDTILQISTQTWWSATTLLHALTVGLPFLLICLKNPQNHLSKLPAVVSVFLATTYAVWLATVSSNSNVNFTQIANTILLVLSYLFYIDQKNTSETQTEILFLESLRSREARQWLSEKETRMVEAAKLTKGDKILVRGGEIIPRDGRILSGVTSVDERSLTQDINPLHKSQGDTVVGGTLNRDSDILIEIEQPLTDDVLSRLIGKACDTVEGKAPLKERALFVAKFFPIFFMLVSSGVGVFFLTIKHRDLSEALLAMITVLLSSPFFIDSLAILTRARLVGNIFRQGIVVSSAIVVEKLATLHTVFFNKTGILTEGKFVHSQDVIQHGNSLGDVLSTIFSLEKDLDHPLAKAITTHPWYNEVEFYPVMHKTFHPGLGVSGTLMLPHDDRCVAYVGNLRFMKRNQCQISRELKNKVDELESLGETVILCGFDKQVRGLISFVDTLRRNVRTTLRDIHKSGIQIALTTGDTEKTVTQLVGALHFAQIYSRCTPDEKIAHINKVQKPWSSVALVTNEIEDELFGNAAIIIATDTGVNIHKHPADVLIMGSDIQKLGRLLQQTRLYRKTLRWALWGSTGIGAISLMAAFLGNVQPHITLALSSLWALLLLETLSKLKTTAHKSSSTIVDV